MYESISNPSPRIDLALSHNRLLSLAGSGVASLANCVTPWPVTGWGLEKILAQAYASQPPEGHGP